MFSKNTFRYNSIFLLPLFLAFACRFEPLSTGIPPLTQLSISQGEISNWAPEEDMKVYIGDELFNFMDGGAPEYLNQGCIKTGDQRLVGPEGGQASIMIMDFGNDSNAINMWREKLSQNSGNTVSDMKFSDSIIFITPILGGVTGYTHFANYYFEVNVTGFADQILAIQTLDLVLGLYQRKIMSFRLFNG